MQVVRRNWDCSACGCTRNWGTRKVCRWCGGIQSSKKSGDVARSRSRSVQPIPKARPGKNKPSQTLLQTQTFHGVLSLDLKDIVKRCVIMAIKNLKDLEATKTEQMQRPAQQFKAGALPEYMNVPIETTMSQWLTEKQSWDLTIQARAAIGRELTPKQQFLYDRWTSRPTRKLVFDVERQQQILHPASCRHDHLRRVGILVELRPSLVPNEIGVEVCHQYNPHPHLAYSGNIKTLSVCWRVVIQCFLQPKPVLLRSS